MHGYGFRENVEAWEKWTGLNFFEHFDLATRSSVPDRPNRYYYILSLIALFIPIMARKQQCLENG